MPRKTSVRLNIAAAMFVTTFALAACGPERESVAPPKLMAFPGTPTAQCVQEEVLPKIEKVEPSTPRPGSEVTVSAQGGYLRDNCGGYIESARTYKIYFDDEPIADLSCYVHYCQGKFVLPQSVSPGAHCMGVQKGTCQVELSVAAE